MAKEEALATLEKVLSELTNQMKNADVYKRQSLNDHILFSGTKTRLSLEECSLVFLDFQTRYNLYYENLGETDFWKEKAGESDFSDYLRDGRIKEELCTLVLLNDMASGLGVTLTDEMCIRDRPGSWCQ